jgi:hypothetical protein
MLPRGGRCRRMLGELRRRVELAGEDRGMFSNAV